MKRTASFALNLFAAIFLVNVAVPQLGATAVFQTYVFEGTCSDCQGTNTLGTGLLTLTGYTQGQAINSGNFIAFSYSSNIAQFSITPGTLDGIGGTIPVSLPAAASVTIFGTNNTVFIAQLNGQWCVSTHTNSCSVTNSSDFGFSGTFDTTPEPSTLGLALAGFAALGWSRRRAFLRR